MAQSPLEKLDLPEPSADKLHTVLTNFELKWQSKARRVQQTDRISRF